MRRLITISMALLVGATGCRDEPTFDERYDAAQEKVSASAERIDRDLDAAPKTPGAAPLGDGTGAPDDRPQADMPADRSQ